MSDHDVERYVTDELRWDPKLDSAAIAVSADDGAITLRGTVGSLREKREAKQDAERVIGVKSVNNQLQVRILNQDRRDDADLRGAVLQALMLDSLVPSTIDAKVDDGRVTLTGSANWAVPARRSRIHRDERARRDRGRGQDRAGRAGAERRRRAALDQEGDGAEREAGRIHDRQRLAQGRGDRDRER